jgi:multiphosphoryl transfer protein
VIVDGANARGKWIGMCGEMAGDSLNLPLMLGLGLKEISVAPGEILKLKSAVANFSSDQCRVTLSAACACKDASAVETLLREARSRSSASASIIASDIIQTSCDSNSKEEAIRDAIDLLFIAGRTADPAAVEAAVWAREETYSTGLGYGFAVPHCKTDAVTAPTLAVLKLSTPIEWGSMDGLPVKTVLLLAVPAAESTGGGAAAHMKVFAKLARKLMHEEFRAKLDTLDDSASIESALREELGL